MSIRPITLLVAAMGGEGGGVLSNWIMSAAKAEGLIIQSTSIPGVAQRTGATTYYLEFLPADAGNDSRPVMSLYPGVGGVDVMVSTELVEAGRAIQNGFVTPERTTLIASTHRVYSVAEKVAMGDERFDGARVMEAARELAREPIMFDMAAAAQAAGSVINAVILGVIAGSGRLPIPAERFETAIREEGKSVERSLAAFRAGLDKVREGQVMVPAESLGKRPLLADRDETEHLYERVAGLPAGVRAAAREGLNRQIDYLDAAYGVSYLDRLERVVKAETDAGGDDTLALAVARHLAVRMSFEDVIRVADLKTRPERLARIREELGAKPGQPVVVTDFLKPGIEEVCSVLPAFIGGPIQRWADRRGFSDKLHVGLHIRTTSIWGYQLMRAMAAMKRFRRKAYRYRQEQEAIEHWLMAIRDACRVDLGLAREIAECARLIKGYSDTHRRGLANYDSIMETFVGPALAGDLSVRETAQAIARARGAALGDPDGDALSREIAAAAE